MGYKPKLNVAVNFNPRARKERDIIQNFFSQLRKRFQSTRP